MMEPCVELYLRDRIKKLEMAKLRVLAKELRDLNREVGPKIAAYNELKRERQSKGDGFVIVS